MKHSRISLIERAAEVYDFGAALRVPADMPMPAEPAEAPAPVVEATVEVEAPAPVVAPREPVRAAPPPRAAGVAVIDRAALAEKGFIVPEGPVTGLAEEFRLVKRQLLAAIERRVSLSEEKRRSVLVCSAQPKEGKSFCAVNLALSLAGERETEVLLIDGDVAKHDMLALLGIEGGPGLVDALADPESDPESFVIRTDVPGLSVLPAGAHANDVTELLASDRMRALLARLIAADSRRIVLFDSPPVLMASPASVLAAHVGQALVVVRADRTTEADLKETIDLLSGCDHVALLLNAAGMAVTGRNFGAYYEGRGHED